MQNTIIKQAIGGIVLLVIGSTFGYNYYMSTPEATIGQIQQKAQQGDYAGFKDCCFEEDLVIANIRQAIEKDIEPENIPLARAMIERELTSAQVQLEANFKQGKLFKNFDENSIKEIDEGFTVEVRAMEGHTNLLTFQNINKGRLVSFPNYKIVEVEEKK